MFSSPVLDLVILLSFIYFVGSLIVSSINEAIAAARRLRPKQLQASMENLLFDNLWPQFLQTKLIVSPHIESLMSAKGTYPSYIPAQNFVLAVIGVIGDQNYTSANLVNAIRTTPALPPSFQKILADLAAQAAGDLSTFEKNLAVFYTNAMDRAGGVYKRNIRVLLLLIGFIVALCANLDTIQIIRQELGNKQVLTQTVDKIVSQLPAIKDNNGSIVIKRAKDSISINSTDTTKSPAASLHQVAQLQDYLNANSSMPAGYADWNAFKEKWFVWNPNVSIGNFLLSLAGTLITAFALQLSSSFWFGLMNKAVNIRAAGKKPDTKTVN
jgi:hypothetical protein